MEIKNENLTVTRIVLTFAQFMFILFPAIILVMLQENNLKETFRLRKPKWDILFYSIIGIIVVQPLLQAYVYYQNELIFSLPIGKEVVTQLKELFDKLESTTANLVNADTVPELLLVIIVIAVTPAICEEFLFRGLVFKNFEKIIPASKAIFLTGLLFAFFHFHPFNLVPLAVLGVFLTFIVYHSGSIYTAVICHFVNNCLSSIAVFIFGAETVDSFSDFKLTPEEQMQYMVLGILSLIFFIAIIFLIKKFSIINDKKISPGKLK